MLFRHFLLLQPLKLLRVTIIKCRMQRKHLFLNYKVAQDNCILIMCFCGHKMIRNLWMTHFFLGYEGISTYFPALWKPSLHPLNCLPPWRQRGQNKTSKYLQNTLDTNSFPRVTRGGLAGAQDDCGAGVSQPPPLQKLVTNSGDGMPFWQHDYGQSDTHFKGARWEETLRARLRWSCWDEMK